jgi:hypothetical protein
MTRAQVRSFKRALTRGEFNARISEIVKRNGGRSIYVSQAPDKVKSVTIHAPGEHWQQLERIKK